MRIMIEYLDCMERYELSVGRKGAASYAAASIAALMSGQRVLLKARGRWIYKAVDVSQIAVKILKNARIASVSIGSNPYTQDGKERMVSYIEIVLELPVNTSPQQAARSENPRRAKRSGRRGVDG